MRTKAVVLASILSIAVAACSSGDEASESANVTTIADDPTTTEAATTTEAPTTT
jgi:ABC-type Fe3+-citrate transport system substrate-binding protein